MLKHLISRMARRLEIPLSGYRLRHSCITHHWEHGLDPYALQSLAGHSDLRTTQIYTKVTIGILQRKYNEVGLFEIMNEKEVDKHADVGYTPSVNQGMSFIPVEVGR
jgi:integrase